MKKALVAGVLVLWVLGCSSGDKQDGAAQGGDLRPELAYLEAFVGEYPLEVNLWETEPLRSRLKELLGGRFDDFLTNMQVQGPISREDGTIYVTGNKRHSGGTDAAVLLVAPDRGANGIVEVYMMVDGQVEHEPQSGDKLQLPSQVETYISNWEAHP